MTIRNRKTRAHLSIAVAGAALLTLGVGASAFSQSEGMVAFPPTHVAIDTSVVDTGSACPPSACTVVFKTDRGGAPSALHYP